MSLPIQKTPVYDTTLISKNKKVKYRPFLVKEEKALLIAEQSEDINTMIETLKSVVRDCTFNEIDVEELAIFDLEYLLAKTRSKAVGETAEINIPCNHCGTKTLIKVDISNPNIVKEEKHTNKIELFDDVGIVMKYPKIEIIKNLEKDSDVQVTFESMIDCIDYIYDSENIYHAKDKTRKELEEFLESLTSEQFEKIEAFFDTMPKLEYNIDYKCPSCGQDVKRKVEGIHNFF